MTIKRLHERPIRATNCRCLIDSVTPIVWDSGHLLQSENQEDKGVRHEDHHEQQEIVEAHSHGYSDDRLGSGAAP